MAAGVAVGVIVGAIVGATLDVLDCGVDVGVGAGDNVVEPGDEVVSCAVVFDGGVITRETVTVRDRSAGGAWELGGDVGVTGGTSFVLFAALQFEAPYRAY